MRRLCLLLCLVMFSAVGCKAKTDMGKELILLGVESLSADYDSQLTMIARATVNLERRIEKLGIAKTSAEGNILVANQRILDLDQKRRRADELIEKTKPLLEKGTDIEFSGKTLTQQQLKEIAEKVSDARRTLDEGVEAIQRWRSQSQQFLETFDARVHACADQIQALKSLSDKVNIRKIGRREFVSHDLPKDRESPAVELSVLRSHFAAAENGARSLATEILVQIVGNQEMQVGSDPIAEWVAPTLLIRDIEILDPDWEIEGISAK